MRARPLCTIMHAMMGRGGASLRWREGRGGEGDGAEPHSAGASSQPEEAREKARVERVQEWLIHEEVVGGRLAGGQEA